MEPSSNKKLIIIGATSGIGKELVKRYVQDGCTVGITGRRKELLIKSKTSHRTSYVVHFRVN